MTSGPSKKYRRELVSLSLCLLPCETMRKDLSLERNNTVISQSPEL